VREILFSVPAFRLETLGTPESIDRITREDVIRFYDRLRNPAQMVVTVYGDVKAEEISQRIKQKFGDLVQRETARPEFKESPPRERQDKTVFMDKEQALLMIGFQGPELDDADRDAMEVIVTIMGASLSGRMFDKIRDELGQAYTLGSGYIPGPDTGFIYFYVNTTDAEVERVRDVLLGQLEALQREPVSEEELAGTKTYIKGTFTMGLETNSQLSFLTSLDELYGLGYNYFLKNDERIDSVTEKDIRRLAEKYLSQNKAVVILTRPKRTTVEPKPEGM
jgi:zinc protease